MKWSEDDMRRDLDALFKALHAKEWIQAGYYIAYLITALTHIKYFCNKFAVSKEVASES